MTDPRRLIEETESEFERALLGAGREGGASPGLRTKTLAAIGVAGVTLTTSAAAGTVGTSLLAKLGWANVLGLGAALVLVGAVPIAYFAAQGPSAPTATAPVLSAHSIPATPPAPPASRPTPVPEAIVAEPPPAGSSAPRASVLSARPATSAEALLAELSALDAVRSRLSGGNAAGALKALEDYDRAHPRGRLRLEAEVLRIDALVRSGRRAEAQQRADAFLARHPNSALASRVRQLAGR